MAIRRPEIISKSRPREFTVNPQLKLYFDNIEAYLRQLARKVGDDEDAVDITDPNLAAIAALSPENGAFILGNGDTWGQTASGALAFKDSVDSDDFSGILAVEKGGTGTNTLDDFKNSLSQAGEIAARVSLRS